MLLQNILYCALIIAEFNNSMKLSGFLRLGAEGTLENPIKLGAEGARLKELNLSGKRTGQIRNHVFRLRVIFFGAAEKFFSAVFYL